MLSFNFTSVLQIMNFIILMVLLTKFLYKPFLNMMDERKNKVATDLSKAEELRKDAEVYRKEMHKELERAREEARQIIEAASERAKVFEEEQKNRAKSEAMKIIEDAKREIEKEREKAFQNVKAEAISIAILLVKRILGEQMNIEAKRRYMENVIKELTE
ncbi:MAG: F0F1 ATP synthase subunit B [Thermotogae bacterium]|nr:F0F1 ATP synthase subunit B [Thermotogota bacterium]